ncbi:MAG: hypothetical protein LBI56_02240 [Puniceicoccales bacterium]|jgi:hypothetical protein|nr:hypothetical protein [Puniceicoccales bacterium]
MQLKITAIVCALLSLLLFTFFLRRKTKCEKRKPSPIKISPLGAFRKDLRQIRQQMSAATSQEFSRLLSRALKIYLGATLGIPSLKMSSEEIIDKLLSSTVSDWTIASLLAEILQITDSVKYSKRRLSLLQQRGIYGKACKFIILSERFLRRLK